MEKLTPKEWGIKTYLDIQDRKAKAAARKKKGRYGGKTSTYY